MKTDENGACALYRYSYWAPLPHPSLSILRCALEVICPEMDEVACLLRSGAGATCWQLPHGLLPFRTLRLLEENAASCSLKHTGQACAPYLVLARHLPFKPAAMAATALLNRDSLKGSPGADDWTTEHGVELAAGLLKHAAVGADSVAALSQLSSQGECQASRSECLPILYDFVGS